MTESPNLRGGRGRRPRLWLAAAAVAMTALLAPSAMGATIVSNRGCHREGTRAAFVGSGFQPGQVVAISLDGRQIGTQPADALGRVGGSVPSLSMAVRSEVKRTLAMVQTTNPALKGAVVFTQTQLYVVTKPRTFRPGRRFRIRAGGFYGVGNTLYAHVRGPKRRNLRIGRVKGACGKVAATRKVILKRGDRIGFYVVQFDTQRKYFGRKSPLYLRKAYRLRRIFRFSRSSSFASPPLSPAAGWAPADT